MLCFWCVWELDESMTNIEKRLGLSQPAVGYAVDRGDRISENRRIKLVE